MYLSIHCDVDTRTWRWTSQATPWHSIRTSAFPGFDHKLRGDGVLAVVSHVFGGFLVCVGAGVRKIGSSPSEKTEYGSWPLAARSDTNHPAKAVSTGSRGSLTA